MAYGKIYQLRFTNIIQNDVFRLEILKKDYAGASTDLTGAEEALKVAYTGGDTNLLEPIQAMEITFSFSSNTIGIEDFYSDDDEAFRTDIYYEGATDKLLHSGYLVQDGASEALLDTKHIITLKATDNLALLKNIKLNEIDNNIPVQVALGFFIREALKLTGLYSHDSIIDQSLPLRIYSNVFENTEDDRTSDDTKDPFGQSVVYPSMFKSTEGEWSDCYTILLQILGSLNATLFQADGCWNVIRRTEYALFDGAIPGTEYIYNGSGTDVNPLTLDSNVLISRKGAGDFYPINEDQLKLLQRPERANMATMNYFTPPFIIQQDLQIAKDAVPFETTTDGDLRIDKYDLATYFPDWVQRGGDDSYFVIVTDTVTDREVDRYIHKPQDLDHKSGVQFNPIPVSTNDSIDFSLQFKTHHSDGYFWVIFVVVTTDGNYYSLDYNPSTSEIEWNGPHSASDWYTDSHGVRVSKIGEDESWFPWTLDVEAPVLIPAEGLLLIQVDGNSSPTEGGFGDYATEWKDINLNLSQYINDSTQITGHTHTNTGNTDLKAVNETEIQIDDTPRNTIAGTLFTSAITNFGYTDTDSGEDTGLANVFFTKTLYWHRGSISEGRRLGDIITAERQDLKYTSRLIVDGTFRNLRYDTDSFVSLLTCFQLLDGNAKYEDKRLLPASITLDYMKCSFNGRLIEAFTEEETLSKEYDFEYIIKTE